jgi:4-hydroxy-tetrahydrodipicolinate synthase
LIPITRAVYHRQSHIESTTAMKIGLVQRGIIRTATVRSPLMPLEESAPAQIRSTLAAAGVSLADATVAAAK